MTFRTTHVTPVRRDAGVTSVGRFIQYSFNVSASNFDANIVRETSADGYIAAVGDASTHLRGDRLLNVRSARMPLKTGGNGHSHGQRT